MILVLYSASPALTALHMNFIGVTINREKHGNGPEHWVIKSPKSEIAIVEVYPATPERPDGTWRYL